MGLESHGFALGLLFSKISGQFHKCQVLRKVTKMTQFSSSMNMQCFQDKLMALPLRLFFFCDLEGETVNVLTCEKGSQSGASLENVIVT